MAIMSGVGDRAGCRYGPCKEILDLYSQREDQSVNLLLWLPALFLLGLATMALLFAFVIGCEKV